MVRNFFLVTFLFYLCTPINRNAQTGCIRDMKTGVSYSPKRECRKMNEIRYSEDEIVAAYAEIEGTDTNEVRALRAYWRTRYGDDFKDLRCQNTIAKNWLNIPSRHSIR